MGKAYVVAAKRSAIRGSMGGLTNIPLADLGAAVLSRTIEEAGIDPASIDGVIVGSVVAAGLGQDIRRQVSIKAGVPVEICAQSLNILCGSGLKAITEAAMRIQCGFGNIFVAGDVESMTNAPYLVPSKVRNGVRMGDMKMVDSMLYDGLTDSTYRIHMDVTTDNIAEKYSIPHEDQDTFAYASRQKAITAIDSGRFQDEVVPVEVPGRKGSVTVFDADEHPNHISIPERLVELRPAFTKDSTVTAGNASGINDGASFTIIASEDTVKRYNLTPLTEVIGIDQGSIDPRVIDLDPTPAVLHTLKYVDLCIEDMELVRLNEAFATQSLGIIHGLEEVTGTDRNTFVEKTNVNGGAIVLGHPVGTSGDRVLANLFHEMQKRDLKIGLASLCINGGQGTVVIIKRI